MKFVMCVVVAAIVVFSSSMVEAGCPGGRCGARGRVVRGTPVRTARYVVGGKVRHIQMPRLRGVCSNGRCSNN